MQGESRVGPPDDVRLFVVGGNPFRRPNYSIHAHDTDMTIYVASNGRYYSDWEVGNRFEEGRWSACMWSETDGWDLVETAAEELLYLEPIPRRHLPDGVRVTTNESDFEVVEDTREFIEAPTFERFPAEQSQP